VAKLGEIDGWLAERLPALLAEHDVPGAAAAVYADGEITDCAAGVLSTATGVPATPDSLFQIGSITKTLTTTLVMQLADENLVSIDKPLREYLPGFRVADEDASAALTVRQLLCHTAGFEGDVWNDTGTNDDCVEKYVDDLRTAPQIAPPGEMFSYCNAGFSVLGRLVEVLGGKPFDACLREGVIGPLGLTHTATDANTAIMYRAAVGHLQFSPDAPPAPAPIWSLMKSSSPAGSMLSMRPRDLLTYARAHLADGAIAGTAGASAASDGAAADGARLLSAASARAMRERQVTLPPLGPLADAWGLGWELFDWPGGPVIGHDGGTIGQSAFLRLVPGADVAVALLTNGGHPVPVYREVVGHVLRELADIEIPSPPFPPHVPAPTVVSRYSGTYESSTVRLIVSQDADGRIWLDDQPRGFVKSLGAPDSRSELAGLDEDTLIGVDAPEGTHATYAFLGDDGSGRARYIHTGGRATPRAAG
jgi:CubicO group peptidase (beta-lactamase class C family)